MLGTGSMTDPPLYSAREGNRELMKLFHQICEEHGIVQDNKQI